MDFQSINWNAVFKKLTSPQSSQDLNDFLERMPHNAGHTVLIADGIAWAFAAAIGLFTTVQIAKKLALILSLTFALSVNASADGGLDIRESDGGSDTQDMSENIQVQCIECLIPVNSHICDEGRFECQEYTSPL